MLITTERKNHTTGESVVTGFDERGLPATPIEAAGHARIPSFQSAPANYDGRITEIPMITITLRQILAARPCYDPIARYGLEGMDRDAPISFREIVEVAGGQDAIWCFAVFLPGHEALKRHYAVDCAERVRHLMEDPRSLAALEVARRHALGQATDEELAAAGDAAWDAAGAARDAAGAAAGAAWAAWAAWDAAGAAAWAAEAGDAAEAGAAEAGAAEAAARAAEAAARAARAAAGAAWDAAWAAAWAERDWQGQRLVEITEAGAWTNG